MLQAISEEKWGHRGGDRAARLSAQLRAGDRHTVTQLSGICEHERILQKLLGAVIAIFSCLRPHIRPSVRPSSTTQYDPVTISLASDKHNDKKNQKRSFCGPPGNHILRRCGLRARHLQPRQVTFRNSYFIRWSIQTV